MGPNIGASNMLCHPVISREALAGQNALDDRGPNDVPEFFIIARCVEFLRVDQDARY
jgi:hypothetical protein